MQNKQPNYQFADLLTEAIYTIRRKEGKKISVIQDEITYSLGRDGGNPIEYWRKGNVPTSQAEFAQLLNSLMERGELSRDWLGKIWRCTEFPGLDEFTTQLQADPSTLESLPQKPFATFIGREELSDKLYHALKNEDGNQLIGIDGMGGIGKTALTHSVVSRALAEGIFEDVIWISDGPQQAFSLGANGQGNAYNLSFMLNTVGAALGLVTMGELKEKEKIGRIRTLLKSKKMVIILDNLERAIDLDDEALSKLSYLLGLSRPSKILLLSRKRFNQAVFQIHLKGLDQTESVDLLCSEANFRGIERISLISEKEFQEVASSTGGSPLALKLVLGQLSHHDLNVTLSRLQKVTLMSASEHDEYARMFRHIFIDSWEMMSTPAKQLLISMTHFAPGNGGTYDAIKATCGLPAESLGRQIDELWTLAFLEVGDSSIRQTRYYLHALTHYFMLSDVVRIM